MKEEAVSPFLKWFASQRKTKGIRRGGLFSKRTWENYARILEKVPDFDFFGSPKKVIVDVQKYLNTKPILYTYAIRTYIRYLEHAYPERRIELSMIRNNLRPPYASSSIRDIKKAREMKLTKEEIRRGIKALKGLKKKMFVWLLYDTACRITELINVKKKDINFSNNTILIEEGKGGYPRVVRFEKTTAEYLKKYVEKMKDNDKIFNFSRVYGFYIVKEFAKAIGKNVSPHSLRHSRLSHLAETGISPFELKELAGWSSISLADVYVKLRDIAIKTGRHYKDTDLWKD